MEFEYRYSGASSVSQSEAGSSLSFAPDTLRPPTYFSGRVLDTLPFRDAMSALHDVVVSDLRFQPKDRTKYLAWRATQDDVDLVQITKDRGTVAAEIARVQAELRPLEDAVRSARAPFYTARARYWKWLYERDRELWFKLDPVITVHPDQVFFECFSRDESSYGRLSATYDGFAQLGERACGTTNVDYSDALYGEFQKLRSYKHTSLDVDPSGFDVKTSGEEVHREVKIDVPESWVRGFLQVSSAMTLPTTVVDLHPMDLHNVCLVLRRNKELFGPRSLRYRLLPGQPVSIVVEPWNIEVRCPRSIYRGAHALEVRTWGRRRLHVLERLLPHAKTIRVHLLGTGQPSFYVVDLGPLSFTLGLSGWTKNDWSASGNFDLLAAREDVDDDTRQRVFAELGRTWLATPSELAQRLSLAQPVVASALAGLVQAGRAVYDLEAGVYRKRELSREPLPVEKLRYASEREASAARLLHRGKIAIDSVTTHDGNVRLAGRVQLERRVWTTDVVFDVDRRIISAECTCDWFTRNRLHRGPCDHMLALRSAHARGVSDVIEVVTPPAPKVVAPPVVQVAEPAPVAEPKKPSFWSRVTSIFKSKPVAPVIDASSPEGRLRSAIASLVGELLVTDVDALVAELVPIYEAHATPTGRLFALVLAVRSSAQVTQKPADQRIIDVLRIALG